MTVSIQRTCGCMRMLLGCFSAKCLGKLIARPGNVSRSWASGPSTCRPRSTPSIRWHRGPSDAILVHACLRWLVLLTVLVLGSLAAGCQLTKPEPTHFGSGITGYNFTSEGVQVFYVEGMRGSNLPPHGGGGAISCCVLRAACCVLRAACCVLRAACCVLRAAAHDMDAGADSQGGLGNWPLHASVGAEKGHEHPRRACLLLEAAHAEQGGASPALWERGWTAAGVSCLITNSKSGCSMQVHRIPNILPAGAIRGDLRTAIDLSLVRNPTCTSQQHELVCLSDLCP